MAAVNNRCKLTRGCQSCIRAKKRCSRGVPRCARCCEKRLSCSYHNEPLAYTKCPPPREVIADNEYEVATHYSPGGFPLSRKNWELRDGVIHYQRGQIVYRMTEPTMFLPLDADTHAYLVHDLIRMPFDYARTRTNSFIHPRSYQQELPLPLQVALDICRLRSDYSTGSYTGDAPRVANLTQKVLSYEKSTASFRDTLAFVQSLCLLQILTLFNRDTSPEEYTKGVARQPLLVEWTKKLWRTAPNELPSCLSKREAYLFGEAVRRTILMSHKIQGCFRVARTGFFIHTIFVETLPFGGNGSLWDSDDQDVADDGEDDYYSSLLSYRELCERWDSGLITSATRFEKLLLAGCKGKAVIEAGLGPLTEEDLP